MARGITEQEQSLVTEMLGKARAAMCAIENYDQATVDRLCRAIAWATANEQTASKLGQMSVDDLKQGLRDLGRKHYQRKYLMEALHECDLG
jgi:sulfoacetaldehyde dehydrogenase